MDHIQYCNEIVRRMADWAVSVENFKSIPVPSDLPGGVIVDGSPGDGRPQITGDLVRAFLSGDMNAARAICVNPAKPE